MTLDEAKSKYLHKKCDVYWGPLDRPKRNNESLPGDTKDVYITDVYSTCYNEIYFRCDKLATPFSVNRLKNIK